MYFIRNYLVHRNFTSDVYKFVSVPYYTNVSFNGLPKRNVDFFDFYKYEDFDSLEESVATAEHLDLPNFIETSELSCSPLETYSEIISFLK